MNFGIARSSTECCKTDLCNSQKTPELNTNMTPNGKKCFTCEGDDCTKQLSCVGNEDRCIKATELPCSRTTTNELNGLLTPLELRKVQLYIVVLQGICYNGTEYLIYELHLHHLFGMATALPMTGKHCRGW
ncbi:hypothetical protein AALO_G00139770 [Alosa alosa]|uniref:UPAR/Ly6 domain-containing protein n=1 Tax=Alosa alosa TaxID=278164 RepID=A0AAV6GIL3_9TELE|nr:hypothetical protein AALO_G00139770 [Alosa alosa]